MTPLQPGYRAYLLRLWRTPKSRWWASLEDAHTGQRQAFATVAQLVAFLDKPLNELDPGEASEDKDQNS